MDKRESSSASTVLIILYILIIAKVYQQRKVLSGSNNPHANKVLRKVVNEVLSLVAYPLICFVLALPLLANRIYSSANASEPSLVLWYLAALTFPLQGACTGFIFTFSTVICRRTTWVELRSRTEMKSRSDTRHRVSEYPMKADEVSDSTAFTIHRQHPTIDNTNYTTTT